MAPKRSLDEGNFTCSICLDLLNDAATIPCGHSYCLSCIKTHWDGEAQSRRYSCPQCRKVFTSKPILMKSALLAALVEALEKIDLQAAPAGPEDVSCDICTERKLKAVKSCRDCLLSYCEKHLQPHCGAPPLQKHRLVEPSKKLQENICPCQDQADQQCLCITDDREGHKTVSAAAGRAERQKELRQQIQQRIEDRETDVKLLQQEVVAIDASADKTIDDYESIFSELFKIIEKGWSDARLRLGSRANPEETGVPTLHEKLDQDITKVIKLIQKKSSFVKVQLRCQQEREVSRVRRLQERLEQEIAELKRKAADLQLLSLIEDHDQFVHSCASLSALRLSPHAPTVNVGPLRYFKDVIAAVLDFRDKLLAVVRDAWTNVSADLLPEPKPRTRDEFLKYSQEITLDPNTAHGCLLLSDDNRKATLVEQQQCRPDHPNRFTRFEQVLSRESLSGRCYWEMEWRGRGVCVAVTYEDISRNAMENDCRFGWNDKSWALYCGSSSYAFCYNKDCSSVFGPGSFRLGVYLDHRAGVLSFYSISEFMTLLYKVRTTFTAPLHAGVWVVGCGTTVEFVKAN